MRAVAAALDVHPGLLVSAKKPDDAWTYTQYAFDNWILGLRGNSGSDFKNARGVDMVKVFLATRPEHGYARRKLLTHANRFALHKPEAPVYSLDAEKWVREAAAAKTAQERAKRGKE